MKHLKFLILAIVAFTFSVSADAQQTKSKKKFEDTVQTTFLCPMKCEGEKTYPKAGDCPECGMLLKPVAAQASYQCPMKCEGEKTYSKEGKCPVCNMNLAEIKKKEIKKEKKQKNKNKRQKANS